MGEPTIREGHVYIDSDVVEVLKTKMKGYSSQQEFAHDFGISPQYLTDILKRRREISASVAFKLGFKRETVFIGSPIPPLLENRVEE